MRLADIRVVVHDDAVVATLSGEIDMSNAPDLRAVILEALDSAALGLVVDLEAVEYLDSAGIHLLFEVNARLAQRRQKLLLALPEDSPLRDVMRIVALPSVVGVHPDVDAAVDALRK